MSIFIGVGKDKHYNRNIMCKSEIFTEILEAVSRETEVSASQILGDCKQMEVVDARSIASKILRASGRIGYCRLRA